ncbi:hypothetical protein EV182_005146 [Spiromyces aspiralis]|uniref:Uncharacterized protein n=1 Tax=Spiromyces aspiralis TaxID=68401 RepID=A0ACC1HMZ4_9FUNG|nr:hypothetical protein EV182_005146 [Spiromyces aspiralis]
MGLAEPKRRQRIGVDPRNLNWSNDKSKFGFKMLQKMGWVEGRGLGADENGMKEHIKIKTKHNNFGVGCDLKTANNWLEHSSALDSLFSRLNDTSGLDIPKDRTDGDGNSSENKAPSTDKKKDTKENKKKRKNKKEEEVEAHGAGPKDAGKPADSSEEKERAAPSRLTHRAKFQRMKRMAVQDSRSLQEILGLKSAPVSTTATPAVTAPTSRISTPKIEPEISLSETSKRSDGLMTMTSTMNISDYFSQKMDPRLQAILNGSTRMVTSDGPSLDHEKNGEPSGSEDKPKPDRKDKDKQRGDKKKSKKRPRDDPEKKKKSSKKAKKSK